MQLIMHKITSAATPTVKKYTLQQAALLNKAGCEASLTWQNSDVHIRFSVLILRSDSHLECIESDS